MREPRWEQAYCEFFAARQRPLMRTAYGILGSWAAAEDAVQTTLTQMYVHWPRIQPGAVDAYARRTLVNTCLRTIRTRGREVVTDDIASEEPGGPRTPAPPDDPAHRLDLIDVIRTLPPLERAVLTLRYLDDLPVSAVADALDVAPGTVKSQTSRALGHLRERLGLDQGVGNGR